MLLAQKAHKELRVLLPQQLVLKVPIILDLLVLKVPKVQLALRELQVPLVLLMHDSKKMFLR